MKTNIDTNLVINPSEIEPKNIGYKDEPGIITFKQFVFKVRDIRDSSKRNQS